MKRKPSVILFDLWRTLGHSLERDPIYDLQEILGHNVSRVDGQVKVIEDPRFMRSCLTTDISDQRAFLETLASQYGCRINEESHAAFARLLARETGEFVFYADVLPALKALKRQGYRLGLVSNLWPFPVPFLFNELGLGAYFEHLIYSFEDGHAKPEKEIFQKALQLFAVPARDVLMVGDNPVNDVQGALTVGMRAALIDRSGNSNLLVPGGFRIKSMRELCQPRSTTLAQLRTKSKAVA